MVKNRIKVNTKTSPDPTNHKGIWDGSNIAETNGLVGKKRSKSYERGRHYKTKILQLVPAKATGILGGVDRVRLWWYWTRYVR